MKTKISYSLLAAAMACGVAHAATAYTTPVGYETFAATPGFNFVGVRLQEAAIASGTLESFTAAPNRVTDNEVNLGALITGGTTYILELQDGSGIIQEVTSATGTSLNVAANLSAVTYPCSYTLRSASTLNSVFGSTPATQKLSMGAGSVGGADQVWVYNGSGYNKVYYDEFGGLDEIAGWYNVDGGAAVNGNTFNLIYADGFIVSSATGKDFTISGAVKKGVTELNLVSGFNFVGSVAPAGATLASIYGTTVAEVTAKGLAIGSGTVGGADQLWFFNGSGYTKVYYDAFGGLDELPGWYNVDGGAAVVSTTVIPAGYIISAASAGNLLSGVPSSYSSL